MTDEEMAEEYASLNARQYIHNDGIGFCTSKEEVKQAYLAGLKDGSQLDKVWQDYDAGEDCYEDTHEGKWVEREDNSPKWHKIFENDPYCYEYWELPQDRLPKTENFYFVKLKNGFIKICELKYEHFNRKLCFYDLHGGKQSNVAEWLDYHCRT